MAVLSSAGAVLVVGAAAIVALGWGAGVSILSASRGPRWALGHLALADRAMIAAAAAGIVLAALMEPAWAGLGVVYVASVTWFFAGLVHRTLVRLDAFGGLVGLDPARQRAIVQRARRGFGGIGILFAVLAGAGWAAGPAAWVVAAGGAVLLLTAALLR